MDEYILNAIDIRKKSFFDYYEIKNREFLLEIEELFNEINNLGESSKDVSDFEAKFASSELNTKYLDLLTKVAKKCKLKEQYVEEVITKEDLQEKFKEDLQDDIKHYSREAYLDTHSAIDRKFGITDKIRSTPILGGLLELENQTDVFSNMKEKLFKKRKEKDNNIEENIENIDEEN